MAQYLSDALLVRIADEQSARLSPYFTEALATLADGRGVYQEQHLLNIAEQERIEQRLVGILQITEKGVLIKGSRLLRQCLHPALHLLIQISNMRGKQTVQIKHVAFAVGERSPFVETRRIDQIISGKRNLPALSAGC